MSYKKILENLEALPEDERLLAAFLYFYYGADGKRECGCVLGKGLLKFFAEKNLSEYDRENELGIEVLLRREPEIDLEGMSFEEARDLQKTNDNYAGPAPEDPNSLRNRQARYAYIVNWLKERQDA